MKYRHFEKVPVWKDGTARAVRVSEVTNDKAFRLMSNMANRMQRTALFVPNNIVEDF